MKKLIAHLKRLWNGIKEGIKMSRRFQGAVAPYEVVARSEQWQEEILQEIKAKKKRAAKKPSTAKKSAPRKRSTRSK